MGRGRREVIVIIFVSLKGVRNTCYTYHVDNIDDILSSLDLTSEISSITFKLQKKKKKKKINK